ncbi:MAG: hypothetical protein ETSY2_29980, partial [Candidatus Entotheonella gemina]
HDRGPELQALSTARREAGNGVPPAAIGSVKANIGHTKAAAGVAGLIKATMALYRQSLPPTTGCEAPHPLLTEAAPALRVLRGGACWPADLPLRAGVSAMGFGGINTHLVLEGIATERCGGWSVRERVLLASAQDAELFLLGAQDAEALQTQVEHLLTFAARLSRAELTDLAAQLAKTIDACDIRAAVVASNPIELASGFETLRSWLANRVTTQLDIRAGVFLSTSAAPPRIGFLFPGQGSPMHLSGGAWHRRFSCVQALYTQVKFPTDCDGRSTAVAQPAIVTASMAALRVLHSLGVTASIAIGHSLGELTALHWAGVLDEQALLRIATVRGKAMMKLGSSTGAMVSIGAGQDDVAALLGDGSVVIAGVNTPRQTVVSGEASAVAEIVAQARTRGLSTVTLPVSHAFHSPLVSSAIPLLAEQLAREIFHPVQRTVVSTVTGAPLTPDQDLRTLLADQVTAPVRFTEAVAAAAEGVGLWIEIGPGEVLSGLLRECIDMPVVSLDAGGPSLKGLLQAVGAAFVLGAPIHHEVLFAERFTRPFDLNWQPRFLTNPCELAPQPEIADRCRAEAIPASGSLETRRIDARPSTAPVDLIRQLVAARTELPISAVHDDSRLLGDLHLNSITVAQLVAEAARHLGSPPPVAPTDYADATVAGAAQALEELARTGGTSCGTTEAPEPLSGVDAWIRPFMIAWLERPLPRRQRTTETGVWRVIAPSDYPLTASLQQSLNRAGGGGVVVCLPPEPDAHHVSLLLEGARAVWANREGTRFVLVQHGGSAAAFARTLHLEMPEVVTCVVDLPMDHPHASAWVVAEVHAAVGFVEARYDAAGTRREPRLRLLSMNEEDVQLPLGPNDVLVVTGGGKGIAAECAFCLARETGVRLVLLGRSQPAADAELAVNLKRMAAAGIDFRYMAADVTDAEAVRVALCEVKTTLGPVTALLHGAGTNVL